jgi:hypothetical protein
MVQHCGACVLVALALALLALVRGRLRGAHLEPQLLYVFNNRPMLSLQLVVYFVLVKVLQLRLCFYGQLALARKACVVQLLIHQVSPSLFVLLVCIVVLV